VHRATLDIDEDILAKAAEILGTSGVNDTVDEALLEVVRREAGKRLMAWWQENEDLLDPEIMERAWQRSPRSAAWLRRAPSMPALRCSTMTPTST
jgi:Arc/MetJ family transcription regulator